MNTYTSKSTVDRKEAEALKEMIFNRVRARAEAMNNEVQASYVDNVHNELMDSARVSFEATKNPFSLSAASPKVEQKVQEKNVEKADVVLNETEKEDYKKFKKWLTANERVTEQNDYRTVLTNEKLIKDTISSTMDEARAGLEKKSTFMGALNFLNSQATIALVNNKAKRFEAVG